MKNAQRVILSLLLNGDRAFSKTRLVKTMFLLSREVPEARLKPFYEFLPYKYGPFSFVLYRDLDKLAREGWLMGSDQLEIPPDRRPAARKEVAKLSSALHAGISHVRQLYGSLSDRELIDLVYSRYPSFTCLSELQSQGNVSRVLPPVAPIAIYTIGYEGISVDGLLNACVQHGIKRLLDVRNNPCSRKWGLSKKTLSNLCRKLNLEYLHLPELGIPSALRKKYSSPESRKSLLDYYEKAVLPKKREDMKQALEFITGKPAALVCMEADVRICHRGRLAEELSRLSGLPVHHLNQR